MRIVLLAMLSASVLCGCSEEKIVSPAHPAAGRVTAPAVPPRAESGQPQAKLPTVKLWVGTNEVTAEIASTRQQISVGMMWRTNMAEMDGMLFVFGGAQSVSFYMRNTLLPLTCAYIDPEESILEIYDMKPQDETPIPSASGQVQYVLEMNQGWFQRHGITPGTLITSQHGSLRQTFFRRQR